MYLATNVMIHNKSDTLKIKSALLSVYVILLGFVIYNKSDALYIKSVLLSAYVTTIVMIHDL